MAYNGFAFEDSNQYYGHALHHDVWRQHQTWSYMPPSVHSWEAQQGLMDRFIHDTERPWTGARPPLLSHFPVADDCLPETPMPVFVADYHIPTRLASPSSTGESCSDIACSRIETQSTSWSSPSPGDAQSFPYVHHGLPGIDAGPPPAMHMRTHGGGCVSMHDVQFEADESSDQPLFDEGFHATIPEEGYSTQDQDMDGRNDSVIAETCPSSPQTSSTQSPNIKRRRVQLARSSTSPTAAGRAPRRSSASRRRSSCGSGSSHRRNESFDNKATKRAFPCIFVIYGCQSTFGSKNEWKRHVFTQHIRTGFWRCDLCNHNNRKPNDFNRKDLFIQHIRRMHSPDQDAEKASEAIGPRVQKEIEDQRFADIAERCYHKTRDLPTESSCCFCSDHFSGANSWEERMEHIGGGHMESFKKAQKQLIDHADWEEDHALHSYLVREKIVAETSKGRWLLTETAQKC